MREVGWVIERKSVTRPAYWDGRAVRFARQEDALRVLAWVVPSALRAECRTAEHMWISQGRTA